MKHKLFPVITLAVLILLAATLGACATPTPQIVEKTIEKVVTQVVTVKETQIVAGTPQVVEKQVTKMVEVTPVPTAKKVYKVTWWQHGPWTSAAQTTTDKDYIWKYIYDKYGLDITIVPAPAGASEADTKLNALIASGQIPDMIQSYWGPSTPLAQQLVDQGVLIPLDDYLKTTPYLNTYLKPQEWVYLTFGGKKMAIAQPRPFSNWDTIWIRTDWLEKVGMKTPTTVEELAELAKAFTTKDPDGNGKNDTYGFSAVKDWAAVQSYFAPFGAIPGQTAITVQDNKVVISPFSDQAKSALTWWNAQVKAGVVDPDWTTNTFEAWYSNVAQGKVGIVVGQFQFLREGSAQSNALLGNLISKGNPNAAWDQIPAVKGPYGAYVAWKGTEVDNALYFTRQAKSEPGKMEQLMKLWNDGMDPNNETYKMMVYGLPGRNYVMDDKGMRIQRFTPPDLAWTGYWLVMRRGDEGYFWYYKMEGNQYFKSEAAPKIWDRQQFSISQPQIPTVGPLLAVHPKYKDLETYMREMHTKFATGAMPLADWDKFIAEAKSKYGLQDVLDDYTKQLTKLGLIK